MVRKTVTTNGNPSGAVQKLCSTIAAKYSLKAEPIPRLIRKKVAPVL
jgi:hypothetical protein